MNRLFLATSLKFWMFFHGSLAAFTLMALGQIVFGKVVLPLDTDLQYYILGIVTAYFTSILLVAYRLRVGKSARMIELGIPIIGSFGVYFLLLKFFGWFFEPVSFVLALIISIGLILCSIRFKPWLQIVIILSLLTVFIALILLGERPRNYLSTFLGKGSLVQRSERNLDTAYYAIRTTFFDHYFDDCASDAKNCQVPRNGGGISVFSEGYLIATGEGSLFYATIGKKNPSLNVSKLPYKIPLNSDAFGRDGREESLWKFRVTDILVNEKAEHFELVAAYHFWNNEANCYAFRVSLIDSSYDGFLEGKIRPEWRTIYETKPCLPLASGEIFYGDESGGKLVLLNDHELLLSVGDFSKDGLGGAPNLAQDENADYGKTILINKDTNTAEIYTKGHRNPQGLYRSPAGAIWETEHGPRGGDELNLLTQNANYGWPLVTYGTHAKLHNWPLSTNQGEQEGYEKPVFAWLPDIAISNLIGVKGSLFELWKNDLLIANYKKTLMRLRIRDDKVAYVEPIQLRDQNARIRDILEDKDGRIVLWMDKGGIAVLGEVIEDKKLTQGVGNDNIRGELLFAACRTCHNISDGTSHAQGPDLFGIVGRPIAGTKGYEYSDGLKSLGGNWSETTLDRFLADPQKFAPGTSMGFPGMTNAKDRGMLIEYLKSLKQG